MPSPVQPLVPSSSQPLVVFSHGNSFPATTYRVMLESLHTRGFAVAAIDKYGHDPRFPVTSNWPHLVQQLAEFATAQALQRPDAPLFLAGHSLGGFLSLMCAARQPQLAGRKIAGVLLLDAPVLGGWKAATLGAVKKTPWISAFSPAAVSRKRKNRWASEAEALAHFQSKKAFAAWDANVLQDYIAHGTHDADNTPRSELPPGRLLSFDRAVETAIYNSLPHNLPQLLKKHPLQCPVSFIGGCDSVELRRVGLALTQQVTQGRMMMLDGSHLFPMEKPIAAAAAMEAALRNMAAS